MTPHTATGTRRRSAPGALGGLARFTALVALLAGPGCANEAARGPADAGPDDRAQFDGWRPWQDGSALEDAGVHADSLPPGLVVLSNGPEGCGQQSLAPNAGEEGHLAAVRLTPPTYPFSVKYVRYLLTHGPAGGVTCTAALEHTVDVWASAEVTPAASPVGLTLTVPGVAESQIGAEGRLVTLAVDPPMTISEPQHLFVAVKMVGTHPAVMCLPVDTETASQADRNYWSNGATPPYPWATLASLGLPGTVLVAAAGE